MKNTTLLIISITLTNMFPLYYCNQNSTQFKIFQCHKHKLSVKSITEHREQLHSNKSDLEKLLDESKIKLDNTMKDIQKVIKICESKQQDDSVDKDKLISDTLKSGIKKTIQMFNFSDHNKIEFNEKKSEYIDVELTKNNDDVFQAFAPENFSSLRNLYEITISFNESFTSKKPFKIQDTRKTNNKVFHTADHKFAIQIISCKEQEALISMLSNHFSHFCEFSNSLLPKFSGLYYFEIFSVEYYAVIMPNIYPHPLKKNVDEQFFLKGGFKRAYSAENIHKGFRFLDINFVEKYPIGLEVTTTTHSLIRRNLENDCKLLQKQKAMNYSLSIVLIPAEKINVDEIKLPKSKQKFDQKSKLNEFSVKYDSKNLKAFIGINNVLQKYDISRQLENKLKGTLLGKGIKASVQEPKTYSNRFTDFIINNVFVCGWTTSKRFQT